MATPIRDDNGKFPAFAWPGGYPIFYLFADNEVCCPACANRENRSEADISPETDKQWRLIACDVHWEGAPLFCSHCNAQIESAYGDPEEEAK